LDYFHWNPKDFLLKFKNTEISLLKRTRKTLNLKFEHHGPTIGRDFHSKFLGGHSTRNDFTPQLHIFMKITSLSGLKEDNSK
jgi:hypothetical protein